MIAWRDAVERGIPDGVLRAWTKSGAVDCRKSGDAKACRVWVNWDDCEYMMRHAVKAKGEEVQ